MYSIAQKVTSRIYGKGRGWCFTPSVFFDLGSPENIRKILSRLVMRKTIRRLAQGIFDYPRKHPALGYLPPKPTDVAQALASRDTCNFQPSGATAANILGLSEQVPARALFYTDGPSRKVIINGREIIMRKTTPKKMICAGKISGTVISALKFLGRNNVSEWQLKHLRKILPQEEKQQLLKDKIFAPEWIRPLLERIAEQGT